MIQMEGDISSLILLSEVASSHPRGDFDDFESNGCSCDLLATQVLMELKIMRKKGLLCDLEKELFVPKNKRSRLPARTRFLGFKPIYKRYMLSNVTDLLGFIVPKKKRSKVVFCQNRTGSLKRKRVFCTLEEDDGQIQRGKKQRTTAMGSSSIVTESLSSSSSFSTQLWSFHRKSPLRFSLIKLHHISCRTTMGVLVDSGCSCVLPFLLLQFMIQCGRLPWPLRSSSILMELGTRK